MRRAKSAWRAGVAAAGVAGVLALAVPAAAQEPTRAAGERLIRVTGVGEVEAQPDMAQLIFAVETAGSSAQQAAQQNSQAMERVIQALVGAGVPRASIETRNFSVIPVYDHPEPPRPVEPGMAAPQEPRISGYRAVNMVLLRTRELTRVGALIDVALGAGANRMDLLSFDLDDAEAAQAEALRRAVARARAAAETMAAALGVSLGTVVEATTSVEPSPRGMMMERMMVQARDAAMAVPVQPATQVVRAHATVAFQLR